MWMERWVQGQHSDNRPWNLLLRAAPRIMAGGVIVVVAFSYLAFDAFGVPSRKTVRSVSAAVVFTGQFERVDAGLRLLNANDVPRLYISGVNAGAGILPANFVSQFLTRNPEIVNLQQLVRCCVELGEQANNTFQNARDAQCWVERRGVNGPLLLITSEQHMARAMAAISGTLPGFKIIPYPVHDSSQSLVGPARLRAYFEVIATLVAVRLPLWGKARQIYGPFAEGCRSTDRNVADAVTERLSIEWLPQPIAPASSARRPDEASRQSPRACAVFCRSQSLLKSPKAILHGGSLFRGQTTDGGWPASEPNLHV